MKPSLRVLMIASSLDDDGGLPVCVGQLSAALAGLGHSVEIAGQHAHALAPAIEEARRHANVTVTGFRHPWTVAGQIMAGRELRRFVHQRAAAAARTGERLYVHTHGVWALGVLAATTAAFKVGLPYVVMPHGMLRREAMQISPLKKRFFFSAFVRRLLLNANAIEVTSRSEADDLQRLIPGIDPVLLPLGVSPPTVSRRSHSAAERPSAGYLGRLLDIKNLDGLLYAWREAAPPQWSLRIAGPGAKKTRRKLEQLADSLGIKDRVSVEPPVPYPRIGDFLGSLDLFILPSKSESFAVAVGEALAAGVPVIASTAAPWAGVAEHDCGWSAAPTVPSLATAIRKATSVDRNVLAEMGQRGAEWIGRDFSWPAIAARHVRELYG